MHAVVKGESSVLAVADTARFAATIIDAGVFDLGWYLLQANVPPDADLHGAVADYLSRGEAQGLSPHSLFAPDHVQRQLAALGIERLHDSVLLTYLAHPEAPLDPHPLFDHTYYVRLDGHITPLADYVRRLRAGETPPSPHVLFDRAFYYERNPDVAARQADAFVHYVRQGWRENRQPHPLFDAVEWMRGLAALGIEPPRDNPLSAYCTDPSTWPAAPHPLFDAEYFLRRLDAEGLTRSTRHPPLADLLLRTPERSGHPLFDPAFYRSQARRHGIDLSEHSLAHYAQGKGSGRLDPHPLFCEAYYLEGNREVTQNAPSGLEHFVRKGQAEGRDPNPLFSQKYYRSANPTVAAGEKRLLEHYAEHGTELLDPHPLFDARVYAARYPECLREGDTPLSHYSRCWAEQGVRFPPWGTAFFPCRRAARDFAPPDVLLVSHELSRTGAPAILLRIVEHLVARHGLRTLVLAVKGGELLEEFCEWSATVDMSLARLAGIADAAFVESLRTSIEHCKPRLVIVNTACVDRTVIDFAEEIPVISLIHELASGFPESYFREIYSRSDLVIYPAEFVRNEAHVRIELPIEKAAVHPQGLLKADFGQADAQEARAAVLEEIGAEADAFVVLGCGTLDQRKGLDTFLHVALATVRAADKHAGRPVHFVWVGGGPTTRQSVAWFAQQDIDRSGLAARVHLLGARANTEPYFLSCDAFVVTSRLDPFPCVIHEAMACAKPILAFADSGGAPEALGDGAGIIVDYGDLAAMVEELMELRARPERAARCGERAREIVHSRYDFSEYVDRILSRARHDLGVEFATAPTVRMPQRARGRVIVTLGDSDPQSTRELSERLVARLLDRGFDAELLITGDLREIPLTARRTCVPYRTLGPFATRCATPKERWEALTRVLELAAPVILIHNLDPIASALVPAPLLGLGVLGIVPDAGQDYLEQAARLGRYWQRAVVPRRAVGERVLEAVPRLGERLVHIAPALSRHSPPQPRAADQPLGIVVAGRHCQRASSMPFLLPLMHSLQAAALPFTLTVVHGGPESQLLGGAATTATGAAGLHVVDSLEPEELGAVLRANDVLVLAGASGHGIDPAEAMHAGLVVLVLGAESQVAAPFVDGLNGFRLPNASAQTCARRLRDLARDRELLDRMRIAAHRAADGDAPAGENMFDAYAALVGEMLAELRSGSYRKPAPLYVDPVLGALSLPPMFRREPEQLGFRRNV